MNQQQEINVKKNSTVIYQSADIELALTKMAEKINVDYRNKKPIFIVILNGGLIFSGQLLPKINVLSEIDYCHATRYQGSTRGAELVWKAEPATDLTDRDVVLLDDILDEGITLKLIEDYCYYKNAKSVKTAVLVEKDHQRKAYSNQAADYCELSVPDKYVFGFGMDYSHFLRNSAEIYQLNDSFEPVG